MPEEEQIQAYESAHFTTFADHRSAADPESAAKEVHDEEIARLTRELDALSAQNQALQSRVADLQQDAVREVRRYNDLVSVNHDSEKRQATHQARIDELVQRLDERAKANDRLQAALVARTEERIRMSESYQGVVVDVNGDRVTVVYDVNGSIVEQTYERGQFLEERLPELDTELVVHVIVAEIESRADEPVSGQEEHRDEVSPSRRRPLTGPVVF
jgi:DNA repair exonuclease SbcCD ATPase subunit